MECRDLCHRWLQTPAQVEENVGAADLPSLPDSKMAKVREVYDRLIRDQVHHYW